MLFVGASPAHTGSIDVDLALNYENLQDIGYRSISQILIANGYIQDVSQPFIFHKSTIIDETEIIVEIDFLTTDSAITGTGPSHRTQTIQGIRARKTRGCDLALNSSVVKKISGHLPQGGMDIVSLQVASLSSFLCMKAFALKDRLKEKDAYDIYFCLLNYPYYHSQLIEDFRILQPHDLVVEAIGVLTDKFSSVDSIGPKMVCDFFEVTDLDETERIKRDVFERVQSLLQQIKPNIV